MIQTPLVSIICTTYNHHAYIKDALEGFIMQKTNFPFEIIVHDDASTDNTASIIKEYEEKFPGLFVNIYQKENQFSRKDVNIWTEITFPLARGKYIALCEGDDYWTDPLKLQKQVDFMEKNIEYSMVCHDALVINDMTGTSNHFFSSEHEKKICSTKDVFGLHFCATASILFRKEALSLKDFYTEALAGDMMLVLLLSLNGLLYRMDDVMCVYRKMASGATERNRMDKKKSLMNIIDMFNHFNHVSNFRYRKYIGIEILILKNRIRLLNATTKIKLLALKIYMKILFQRRKQLFA